ncbi:transposase [Ferroplasma sp.]|uniref:transposase n=1 Tax=Ferroplasma sp. TaxID=2591003 RepID=UPI00307F79A9
MKNAIHEGVMKAEELRIINGKIPSPIDLRKEIKPWFDSTYDYAGHHINPVCRSSIAILRSFRKNRKNRKYPEARKLSMRLDSELVKIVDSTIRITIKPGEYEYIPVNRMNKKWVDYSKYKISEVLITDNIVSISFSIPDEKIYGNSIIGADLNFNTIDLTTITTEDNQITHVETIPVKNIAKIQNSFSRRRQKLQKHVRNPAKRSRKLKQTKGRQRKRIKDAMHKTSASLVKDNPDASFTFEDLKGIRKSGDDKGKKFRTYLRPYSEFQKMVEYKSKRKTVYVNPRGTSSECPVCGDKLKHPVWKISRCTNCGQDYNRDRLASLAIALRGLDLCGEPFPVSASASWQSMKDEYLYIRHT